MKKFLSLLLVVLMVLSVAGCSGNEPESEPQWFELVNNDWSENFVDLDTGIKMCYLVMGPEDGTPLVLIHGATDSRLSWAQVAPILSEEGFRVYVPELRGHGKTDKPVEDDDAYTVEEHAADIINFMDKLGIESADITGHSLGTLISQNIAIYYPERAKSITLIASGPKSAKNEALTWCYYGDGTDYLGVHGYDDVGAMPEDFVRDWALCNNEDANFNKAIYLHAAENLPYHVWAHIFGGLELCDHTDVLDKITCPVQIIWGTGDTIFLESDQEALIAGLVNAEVTYEVIDGASHNTHWDTKEIAGKVAKLIGDFAE